MLTKYYTQKRLTKRGSMILNIIFGIINAISLVLISITGDHNPVFFRIYSLINIYSLVHNIAFICATILLRINYKGTMKYWKKPLSNSHNNTMILIIIISCISLVMFFLQFIF